MVGFSESILRCYVCGQAWKGMEKQALGLLAA